MQAIGYAGSHRASRTANASGLAAWGSPLKVSKLSQEFVQNPARPIISVIRRPFAHCCDMGSTDRILTHRNEWKDTSGHLRLARATVHCRRQKSEPSLQRRQFGSTWRIVCPCTGCPQSKLVTAPFLQGRRSLRFCCTAVDELGISGVGGRYTFRANTPRPIFLNRLSVSSMLFTTLRKLVRTSREVRNTSRMSGLADLAAEPVRHA